MRLFCATVLVLATFSAQAGALLTSLFSFQLTNGWNPNGLVQGADGNFYGTTQYGGTNGNWGTVFKISPTGALTTLYSFTGSNDGGLPQAGLVQGNDGDFYGTTYGLNQSIQTPGTVFKITTNGVLTTLHSFTGFNDGENPWASLVQGTDGDFYGTTSTGGTNRWGTVFKISPAGVLTTLYSFTGGNDGGSPQAALVQGSDGNFYGTTYSGAAANNVGTVFKITPTGVLTTLYSFTGANDGASPFAALVQGSDGNFYGTTSHGGTNGGYGTVFKISLAGVLTSLHSFTGTNDGATPYAGLVQGSDGKFYGTTSGGGTQKFGTVFRISTNGVLTSLLSFDLNDGGTPFAALVQGSDGNFYGTTSNGGTNSPGLGTVFKISTTTPLTSFGSLSQSAAPLVQGSDGSFYGTTLTGGAHLDGSVFKVSTNGTLTTLYSFTGTNDGAYPDAGLEQASDGNFYGTTQGGGTNSGYGTIFRITPAGVLTSLYSFSGSNDGANPAAGLVQASDGNFYGTTYGGGTNDFGTVFRLSSFGALASLYSFTGTNDGANPEAGLVQGSDGNFYGSTSGGGTNSGDGTIFKISPAGILTSLHSFTGTNDGARPAGALVQGSDGNFYGTTSYNGESFNPTFGAVFNGYGTVFKISPAGAFTSLYSFSGTNDGANPSSLVQASDGNFYGTTYGGGTNGGYGTIFRISPAGVLTSLYSFAGINDGAYPEAGVVQGGDGNFYGTTYGAGIHPGTVFQLIVAAPVPLAFEAVTLINGALNLTWGTAVGGVYQVQYNSDLNSGNWSNLDSAATATGATLSATDFTTNGPQRFYRLILLP